MLTLLLQASLLAAPSLCSASVWRGTASFYDLPGRTASGRHVGRLTAAHRTLPFGTKVVVTNLANRRFVLVTVTDRGPFAGHRLIDLSRPAARALGFLDSGVARVKVERIH
jgi:rare lipoprotein A